MKKLLTLLIVFVLVFTVFAQTEKIMVQVVHTGSDGIGGLIAYDVREEIRKSQGFELTVKQNIPRMKVILVTLEIPDGDSYYETTSYRSAITIIWAFATPDAPFDAFLDCEVGHCGKNRTKDYARTIVANLDESVEYLQRMYELMQ